MPVGSNGSAKSCYPIQRPVITAVTRELNGTWGSAVSRLKIHGWGFVKEPPSAPASPAADPTPPRAAHPGVQCSAWDDTDMSKSISEATTTHITVDLKDFTPKLAPAILTLGKISCRPKCPSLAFDRCTPSQYGDRPVPIFGFGDCDRRPTKSDTYAEFL